MSFDPTENVLATQQLEHEQRMAKEDREAEAAATLREALIEARGIPTDARCGVCNRSWEEGDENDPSAWNDLRVDPQLRSALGLVLVTDEERYLCGFCVSVAAKVPVGVSPLARMRAAWHDGHAAGCHATEAAVTTAQVAERSALVQSEEMARRLAGAHGQVRDERTKNHRLGALLTDAEAELRSAKALVAGPDGISPAARSRIEQLELEAGVRKSRLLTYERRFQKHEAIHEVLIKTLDNLEIGSRTDDLLLRVQMLQSDVDGEEDEAHSKLRQQFREQFEAQVEEARNSAQSYRRERDALQAQLDQAKRAS